MLLSNLLTLEDDEVEIVATVVKLWCEKNHVDLDSDCGKSAMAAAVNRVVAGEKTPEALYEAIAIQMHIEQYKNPLI
ncbi:hypothetical protein [Rhizobium sp. NXC24]|uniref:hypothetical protein n=1 Tax=Rhizobium sp. NXC24 TaxID=2048897 RepID=UPI000CDF5349|nr:hypothetical protein [Rhizobium sp. NXC24]AVA24890.1 hypothetical protein NXC24_PC00445 [Rhizobium sp. NXC24]